VYEDLETAAARIMLPTKEREFDVVHQNGEALDESSFPTCGSDVDDTHKITSMPSWSLPDDNSGLQDLATQLVRRRLTPNAWLSDQNKGAWYYQPGIPSLLGFPISRRRPVLT
jgi:hypothetical protein